MYNTAVVKLHSHEIITNPFIPFDNDNYRTTIGTAFFIDDNTLLTCYHCIANSVKVFISIPIISKEEYKVEVICSIPQFDIAILRCNMNIKHSILNIGDSEIVESLSIVIALGYPMDSDSLKYTKGIISGFQNDLLQTDASINPGNSGGPLLFKDKVIGINSSKIESGDNIGFSIPINYFKNWYDYIKKNESIKIIRLPYFHITYCNMNDEGLGFFKKKGYPWESGVLVTKSKESVILEGDILYSINDKVIDNYGQIKIGLKYKLSFIEFYKQFTYNDTVTIQGYRNEKTFKVTFNILENTNNNCKINTVYQFFENFDYIIIGGIVIMPLTKNHLSKLSSNDNIIRLNKYNLFQYNKKDDENVIFISNILVGSPIISMDIINAGDIIININNKTVKTMTDVREALKNPIDKNLLLYTNNDCLFIQSYKTLLEIDNLLQNNYKYEKISQ